MLFILGFTYINAQNLVKGKIIDKTTKLGLAGSTIINTGKVVAISKQNGEFSFNLHAQKDSNQILVNYTGYKSEFIKVVKTFIIVELEPIANQLNEVTVSTGIGKIIRKAIERIKYNFPQKQYMQMGIVRMSNTHIEENPEAYVLVNIDAAIKAYYTPYTRNSIQPNVVLIENRIKRLQSENNLRDTTRWSHHWYQPETKDFVHRQDFFVDRINLKKYRYSLLGVISWAGYRVFNIHFASRNEKDIEVYVYIDTATYAFVHANYTRYNIREIFYKTIVKQTESIDYELFGNKWYLNRTETNNVYKLRGNQKEGTASRTFQSLQIDTINTQQLIDVSL